MRDGEKCEEAASKKERRGEEKGGGEGGENEKERGRQSGRFGQSLEPRSSGDVESKRR